MGCHQMRDVEDRMDRVAVAVVAACQPRKDDTEFKCEDGRTVRDAHADRAYRVRAQGVKRQLPPSLVERVSKCARYAAVRERIRAKSRFQSMC